MLLELFFGNFRAAQPVLGAAFSTLEGSTACVRGYFFAPLGRRSLF